MIDGASVTICGDPTMNQSQNETKYLLEKPILIITESVGTGVKKIVLNQHLLNGNDRKQTGYAYTDKLARKQCVSSPLYTGFTSLSSPLRHVDKIHGAIHR